MLEIDLQEVEEGKVVNDAVAPNPERAAGTNPDDKLPAKWVTAAGHKEIQNANDTTPNVTCQLCNHVCMSRKRLLLHY